MVLATLQGRLRNAEGQLIDVDELGLNEVASATPKNADQPLAQNVVRRITSINDIAHYLKPFMNSLGHHITSEEQFYNELFKYRNALAEGGVMANNERIDLDSSQVVYFVRMMDPVIQSSKIKGYCINPNS